MTDHGPQQKPEEQMDAELRQVLRRSVAKSECPGEGRWLALVGGELEASEAERLRRHLEDCAACAALAADARRFHVALEEAPRSALKEVPVSRRALGAIAAGLALLAAAWLLRGEWARPHPDPLRDSSDPVAELVAAFEPPPPPAAAAPAGGALVYRGATNPDSGASLAAALVPYRARDFAAACGALSGHGRRFPAEREARYLAAAACLEAMELDQAEALLASLAAVSGDRRDDARALLERLRKARRARPL